MKHGKPASPHFQTVSLESYCNAKRAELPHGFMRPDDLGDGIQSLNGIPFDLGQANTNNVLLLDQQTIEVGLTGRTASYLVFLHVVQDHKRSGDATPDNEDRSGNQVGSKVADYQLEYEDGETLRVPIRRRFAIQQGRIPFGASPFEAIPALGHEVFNTNGEDVRLGRRVSKYYGFGETRNLSGRDRAGPNTWLYALHNPRPNQPIKALHLLPGSEPVAVYALSTTELSDHPLQAGVRSKLRLTLPDNMSLNSISELDDIDIDLGYVISARAALEYDHSHWLDSEPNPQPVKNKEVVIVEYSAHPAAQLHVGTGEHHKVYVLSGLVGGELASIAPAHRPVRLRITEKETGLKVAARLHLHGEAGEYLPPRNHHRKVNRYFFEDNYGEFINGLNQYSYVDGDVDVDLPLGRVYVEIQRGYEIKPLRTVLEIKPETSEIDFELERVLHWREAGWVTADTHVHFLSTQTALLEGQAEGVNVVNLLASQWGEMFSNVTDFDGKTTFGARQFGGDGEFLVRVGTENRMQALGHISLLGYKGRMINPLATGGPSESAIGDPQEVIMAEWAQRCIEQGGMVVLPHGPDPQGERAADVVLGLIHAMEMMSFNPFDAQISPYAIADWYRFLNLGYQIPICGGSDKMNASSLLGGLRTYTQMGSLEFTYENWMTATKAGNTFVTVGPLIEITVNGQAPGSRLQLPTAGGKVDVNWKLESVCLAVNCVEIIVGGRIVECEQFENTLSASGTASLHIGTSTWIALRARGSYQDNQDHMAAHTSTVQVLVGDTPIFSLEDAGSVLEQIEGSVAYLDVLAPHFDKTRLGRMRVILEGAYNRLHERMHRQGVFHEHTAPNQHHHDDK